MGSPAGPSRLACLELRANGRQHLRVPSKWQTACWAPGATWATNGVVSRGPVAGQTHSQVNESSNLLGARGATFIAPQGEGGRGGSSEQA